MHRRCRQRLAPCLLLAAVLLPLAAHAADSDGDGVDDSIDAFPAHVEATTDTDGDGLPDSIDYSKLPGYFYDNFEGSPQPGWTGISTGTVGWVYKNASRLVLTGYSPATYTVSRSVTVPASGGQVSFHVAAYSTGLFGSSLLVDGSAVASYSCFFKSSPCSTGPQTLSFPLTAGTHTIAWRGGCGSGGPFSPPFQCGQLDDVVVTSNSALTQDADDDNDGVDDSSDACPLDSTDSIGNADGDLLCNLNDTDDDNDGLADAADNCPLNANASQLDTDGDGQGNACDSDDDNDGVADGSDKFPLNPAASSDSDSDGFPGSWNPGCDVTCQVGSGLVLDNCPAAANADQLDSDSDGAGNACDADDDNDGVIDTTDKFPIDPTEWADTDNDTIGNNADPDDDNDAVADVADNCPLDINAAQRDEDGDGAGNPCDSDGPGKQEVVFNPGMGASSGVSALAVQLDGKILLGGDFTSFNGESRNRIARLNTDGSLDTTFNPVTSVYSDIFALALQPDGKILLGGNFTSLNGVSRNRIGRLNTDGSLDTTFNPGTGASGNILALALQPDGKILLGGNFISINGVSTIRIARLNTDGSLDTTFNPGTGASREVYALALQPDGKILLGGSFTSFNGVSISRIARLNTDGSLDTTFNPGTGASSDLHALALQPDGRVLLGGGFASFNGAAINSIARLNTDGLLNTEFNPGTGANSIVYSLALQPDGKILLGGSFTSLNGVSRNSIARLNADGSLDEDFSPGSGANGHVSTIVIQPDGMALIGGGFTSYNGAAANYIARIYTGDKDQDGVQDPADAFDSAAASTDSDRDGKPDAWLQPNPYGCAAEDFVCNGLTLDSDDDNDGIPDAFDPAPLDPNSVAPLDAPYKGSIIREAVSP